MNAPPRPTSLAIRFIRHPAVIAIAAIFSLCDFALLPANAGAKRWLWRLEHRLAPQLAAPDLALDVEFVVWNEGNSLHVAQQQKLPADMLGFVRLSAPAPTRGWWAPTVEQQGVVMPFEQLALFKNPEVKRLVIEQVEQLPNPNAATYAQRLRDGVGWQESPLVSGSVHNVITSLFALLLMTALAIRAPDVIRFVTAHRRMARGACPACAYDLRSDLSRGCPECGWRRRDPHAPSSSAHS